MKLWARYWKTAIAGLTIALPLGLIIQLCLADLVVLESNGWVAVVTTAFFASVVLWVCATVGAFIALYARDRNLTRSSDDRVRIASIGASLGVFAPWLALALVSGWAAIIAIALGVVSSVAALIATIVLVSLAEREANAVTKTDATTESDQADKADVTNNA
uniref:hypothetical protein n=1 Tax=Leucobacter chinensis TaxID=2851010 RepID=UPI001C21D66D